MKKTITNTELSGLTMELYLLLHAGVGVGDALALLEQERVHEVRWLHPETGALRSFRVGGERDWEACLAAILSDPAPVRGRSILEHALTREGGGAIYQIHVTGKEVPHGEA